MEIFFITGNKGKFETFKKSFEQAGRSEIKIIQKDLDIVEIQADSVARVSRDKAIKAFEELKAPLIVEDGGLVINALGGFPGVYTKYILSSIGVDGILKLLEDKEDRSVKFISVTTFIDEKGNIKQFERDELVFDLALEKKDIDSPYAWSELWKVLYVKDFEKTLCEFSSYDLDKFYKINGKQGSLQKFSEWFLNRY